LAEIKRGLAPVRRFPACDTAESTRGRLQQGRAYHAEQITCLTQNGRRVAAVAPLDRIGEAADFSIVMTSVDLIAKAAGAIVENVRAAIEHVRALAAGESLVTSDDNDLVGMEDAALSAVYEQLDRTIRFIRSREGGERDTVTFTIKDLEGLHRERHHSHPYRPGRRSARHRRVPE
jgi:hypothetical protein